MLAGSIARAAPGTTYDEVVDLALKKLAFDLPSAPDSPGAPGAAFGGARRRHEPVLVHFPRPAEVQDLSARLSVIEQAIANRKRVTFDYVSATLGEHSRREVDPYGLVYHEGSWLLIGYCHTKRHKVITFRCDRITGAVEAAPKPKTPDFDRPEGFDVRRYASRSPWTFETQPAVDAVLEIHHEVVAAANEDFGEQARRDPLPDGGVRVSFACTNPDYVVARVLQAKGAIVVKAPKDLRARVREELSTLVEKYA
jgi:proteasome accessory factor B